MLVIVAILVVWFLIVLAYMVRNEWKAKRLSDIKREK